MIRRWLISGSENSWWRYQMEIFCRVTGPLWRESTGGGGFPSQRPVKRSFDSGFDLHLNKRWSKQSRRRWFETPSRPSLLYREHVLQHHPLDRYHIYVSPSNCGIQCNISRPTIHSINMHINCFASISFVVFLLNSLVGLCSFIHTFKSSFTGNVPMITKVAVNKFWKM